MTDDVYLGMALDTKEFRQYLGINKHALDDAVIEQPMLFYSVSEAYIHALATRDHLKEEMSTADAWLDSKYRAKGKSTEGAIKSAIQIDPEHEKAFKSYIEAKEKAEILGALKEAFQQRGYMLRDMCSLYVANYFEEGALRGTGNTDSVQYQEKRKALGEAREKRGK